MTLNHFFYFLVSIFLAVLVSGFGVFLLRECALEPRCGEYTMEPGDICFFHNYRSGRTLYVQPAELCSPGECPNATPNGNTVVTYEQRKAGVFTLLAGLICTGAGLNLLRLMVKNRVAPRAAQKVVRAPAIVDWNEVHRRAEEGHREAMLQVALLALAQRDFGAAERRLRKAAGANTPQSKLLLGGLLAERERFDEALPFLQQAALDGNQDAGVLLSLLSTAEPTPRFKVELRQDDYGFYEARVDCAVALKR